VHSASSTVHVTISTKLAQDFKVHGNEGDRQTSRGSGTTQVEILKFYIGDRLHISAQETWFLTGPGIYIQVVHYVYTSAANIW
jgi:hypothetical protein